MLGKIPGVTLLQIIDQVISLFEIGKWHTFEEFKHNIPFPEDQQDPAAG